MPWKIYPHIHKQLNRNVRPYWDLISRFIRHGIGTPEVPNCSTTPLVLLAGAVESRTRLWIRSRLHRTSFWSESHAPADFWCLCNRLFCCLFSKSISCVNKKSAAQPIELFRNGMPDREQHRGGSAELDSTIGPNFAFRSFSTRESCWGVPSPTPALFR